MYDHQAKKLNEQGTFKEIVVEISAASFLLNLKLYGK